MAKTCWVFEGFQDKYPLVITHADALLLLHEEMITDLDEYVEETAKGIVYSGLVSEGFPRDSFMARTLMEMIERRLNQYEHMDAPDCGQGGIMNKPAILIVTLRYEIDGDLEVAKQKLRHAYAPREGRVESISSSGEYGNVLATCISMQAGIQEE